MKSIFKLFILLSCCHFIYLKQVWTQSPVYAKPTKIIPSSPDVAAIQRFGDIPVSPYTGVPAIAVPIYSIKAGDFEAPISINYHASGIKVADEASRVGLGWALSAGGIITRNVMNLDDFASRADAYHYQFSSAPNIADGPKAATVSTFNIQGDPRSCNIVVGGASIGSYLGNGIDFEPDLYHFNFLGYSGTFILKRNKEVVLLKNEKISIVYKTTNGGTWELKTADGTSYIFAVYEDYLDYFSPYGTGQPIVNTWYLTKITTHQGRSIDFIYQKSNNRLRVPGSFFETRGASEYIANVNSYCGQLNDLSIYYYNTPNKEYSKVFLEKIVFDNGYVSFTYGGRDDIDGDVRLNKISLFQSTDLLKSWELGYEYFVATSISDRDVVGTFVTRAKRLKLMTITEKDKSGIAMPSYTFFYNEPSNVTPQKTSFAVDHWGYFNGKLGSLHLAPDMLENNASKLVPSIIGIEGDNRSVDPAFNQLYVLTQIRYPTGGKTVFEYETHDFDIEKSKINDFSYFKNYPQIVKKQIQKFYPYLTTTPQQPMASQISDYLLDLTDLNVDITLTNPTANIELKAFFRFNGDAGNFCLPSGVTVSLCKEDGTVLQQADVAFFISQTTNPKTACIPNSNQNGFLGAEFKNTYSLTRGKYFWKVSIPAGLNYILDASLTIDYHAEKFKQPIVNSGNQLKGADFGGGIRIKRILAYDNETSSPSNVKRYIYHYQDNTGNYRSYGRRMAQPVYAYFDKTYYANSCSPQPATSFFHTWTRVVQSESINPLESSVSGTSVGYDHVIVLEGENGENGKTVYEFENQPHTILDYSVTDQINLVSEIIPRKPPANPIIQNYGNGNIEKQTEFRNKNGQFIPVREVVNSYTELQALSQAVVYGIEKRHVNGTTTNVVCPYEAFVYPVMAKSRKLLTLTTTKQFDQNDLTKVSEQTISYTYDNSTHLQIKNMKQLNSKGDEVATSYTYPLDYTDANSDAALIQMKNASFMHNRPVTEFSTLQKAGTSMPLLIEGTIYKYQYQNNLVSINEIAVSKITSPQSAPNYQPSLNAFPSIFESKFKYGTYDSKGNILQMQKVGDHLMSFIWDFEKQYPIAQAINAEQNAIAYTSFEADATGNWVGINNANVVNGSGLTGNKHYSQTNFSLAKGLLSSSSTYVVSYWSRNGAYTIAGTQTGFPKAIATINRKGSTWTHYEHQVSGHNTISVSGSGSIDELRLYPKDAQMTTYTYRPLVGMTSQTNPDGRTIYYEYDSFNRLYLIRDQDNILKKFCYNYAGQVQACLQ